MNRTMHYLRLQHSVRGIIVSILLLLLFPFFLSSQVNAGESAYGRTQAGSLEAIIIRTDRDIYIAGEKVFFNVMQYGRLSHNAGTISKVVYVDLLDRHNTSVVQAKIATDGISGAGTFRIPDTLRTGYYFIRSFTNLMKNYPQSLFGYRQIAIINPFESLSRIRIPTSDNQADSVLFYPETGSFITGLQTRSGIRCYNSNGDPVVATGTVLNSDNDTLARFITDKYGTALFSLRPDDANPLWLHLSDGTGNGRRFALFPVKENGLIFTISADSGSGAVKLILETSDDFTTPGGIVKAEYRHDSGQSIIKDVYIEKDAVVSFDMNTLPAGLARIEIKDINGSELASRWYYHDKIPGIGFDIHLSPEEALPREKVMLTLTARDENGRGLESRLAVSVVKKVLVDDNHYRSLAREIQVPSLQALNTGLTLPDINDYLIFIREKTPFKGSGDDGYDIRFLPEPGDYLISGYIRDKNTGAPMAGELLSLSIVGTNAHCSFTRSGANGGFSFPAREYGKKEIVIQRLSPETNGYYVDLVYPFLFDTDFNVKPGPCYLDTSRLEEINNAVISMQVNRIYYPFLQKKIVSLHNDSYPDFFGEPDHTIMLSEYIELTTLREVFHEIVPGTIPTGREEKSSLKLINGFPGIAFSSPPLVLIDGVPVYELDKVLAIKSSGIEKIEILNTRYFLPDIIIEGIINIVSRRGDLSILELDQSIFRLEYDGLQDEYEICAPVYFTDRIRKSRIPDYRNTLFWDPDLTTDGDGKATVEFYTSDEAGDYSIIVEGFSTDGRRGRSVGTLRIGK